MSIILYFFFFFNHTATTEIYTLSLHDALPICFSRAEQTRRALEMDVEDHYTPTELDIGGDVLGTADSDRRKHEREARSEEHTSELQSQSNLVCRLLLEKKKKQKKQVK